MLKKINPNSITTFRLILAPIALVCLMHNSLFSLSVCLALMAVIELTDFLDGYIARKYGKITDWGKVYDPMCDAIFHIMMYIGLIVFFPNKLFVLMVATIFFREFFVAYLRVYCACKGLILAAMPVGKLKANFQMASIFSLIIWILLVEIPANALIIGYWEYLSIWLTFLAWFLTVLSLLDYGSFVRKSFR